VAGEGVSYGDVDLSSHRGLGWRAAGSSISNPVIWTGDLVGVLIRPMSAVNDMSLAADANDFWADTTERRPWLVTHLHGAEN
jgi:hypothetical protein